MVYEPKEIVRNLAILEVIFSYKFDLHFLQVLIIYFPELFHISR